MGRWLLTLGFTLLAVIGGYKLYHWVQDQVWHLFVFDKPHHLFTAIINTTGWHFLSYTWPFVLVGMGIGGVVCFYAGLWCGNTAVVSDYHTRHQHLLTKEQQLKKVIQDEEQRLQAATSALAQSRQQVTRQLAQQQEKAVSLESAYLAQKVALEAEKAAMLAKLQTAFEERDSARQRAKRLQDQLKSRKAMN